MDLGPNSQNNTSKMLTSSGASQIKGAVRSHPSIVPLKSLHHAESLHAPLKSFHYVASSLVQSEVPQALSNSLV